jgi:uncharacterized protein (DUF2267 family)
MAQASLLETLEQTGGVRREEAERAVRAALRTLAGRNTRGQAEDIRAVLPHELRGLLTLVEATLETLAVQISEGEVEDLRRKLPGRAVFAASRPEDISRFSGAV